MTIRILISYCHCLIIIMLIIYWVSLLKMYVSPFMVSFVALACELLLAEPTHIRFLTSVQPKMHTKVSFLRENFPTVFERAEIWFLFLLILLFDSCPLLLLDCFPFGGESLIFHSEDLGMHFLMVKQVLFKFERFVANKTKECSNIKLYKIY